MLTPDFTPFPVLETARFWLRAFHLDDLDATHAMRSDAVVNRYLDRPAVITREDTLDFMEKIKRVIEENQSILWVISPKTTGQLAGTICLWNLVPALDQAEIGYEMLPAFYGQGVMQEAMEAVMAWGVEVLKLKKITAIPHQDNEPSIRVLLRNGFARDLQLEQETLDLPADEVIYTRQF